MTFDVLSIRPRDVGPSHLFVLISPSSDVSMDLQFAVIDCVGSFVFQRSFLCSSPLGDSQIHASTFPYSNNSNSYILESCHPRPIQVVPHTESVGCRRVRPPWPRLFQARRLSSVPFYFYHPQLGAKGLHMTVPL